MSFFNKRKTVIYEGYQMLKDILKQEQDLSLYQGRVNVIVKQETYAEVYDEQDISDE